MLTSTSPASVRPGLLGRLPGTPTGHDAAQGAQMINTPV
jgi:hypothetical protein